MTQSAPLTQSAPHRPGGKHNGIPASHQRRSASALIAIAILAAACSGSSADDQSAQSVTTAPTPANSDASTSTQSPTGSETEAKTETAGEEAPVQDSLDWFLTILNGDGPIAEAEVVERFAPTFLAEVPANQLVASIPQIQALAQPPYSLVGSETTPDGLQAEAVVLSDDDQRLAIQISVEATAPHLIHGLFVKPTELEFPSPVTIDAIDSQLSELGPTSALSLYDVSSGECVPVHDVRANTPIALGSVFKLWVLATLADEIENGNATWDEEMVISDELRSTPDGDIYDMETGAKVTLLELAEAMISISDNTATDMLLDRLGREPVEATMQRIGVADPAANTPFLSTGNLFALKFIADQPTAADYRALDEAGKRSLLVELDEASLPWTNGQLSVDDLGQSTNADGVPIDQPRDLDIEWFATTLDLCRTMTHLDDLAASPGLEPVASILEINPGVGLPFDRDRWPTIRFKGGSEPGVLAGAWWFEGPDGDRYVLAGGVNNPDDAFNQDEAVLTIASAIALID